MSKIEIELKHIDKWYGTYINIPNEETEYFYIYFDNSNKEIKKNHLENAHKIKTIKIIIDYQIQFCNSFFDNYYCIS